MRLLALAYPITDVAMITAAMFQSIGRATEALRLTLGGSLLIKLPVPLLAAHFFALTGIWAAEASSEAIWCVVALFMLKSFQSRSDLSAALT